MPLYEQGNFEATYFTYTASEGIERAYQLQISSFYLFIIKLQRKSCCKLSAIITPFQKLLENL